MMIELWNSGLCVRVDGRKNVILFGSDGKDFFGEMVFEFIFEG